jgi:hypothetical protein
MKRVRKLPVGNFENRKPPDDEKPIGMCTLAEIVAHIEKRDGVHFLFVCYWPEALKGWKGNLAALRSDKVNKWIVKDLLKFIAGEYDL